MVDKHSIVTDVVELRKKSEPVQTAEEAQEIIQALEASFKGLVGFGLSAPQIGIKKQVAILRVGDFKLDLINPIILAKQNKTLFRKEVCFSFPGLTIDTDRYLAIVVEFGLPDKRERLISTDMEAIAIQHEIDHLKGVTILDRKHRGKK